MELLDKHRNRAIIFDLLCWIRLVGRWHLPCKQVGVSRVVGSNPTSSTKHLTNMQNEYKLWLQSAYDYYHTDRSPAFSDAIWDQLSVKYAPIISAYFDNAYLGGSLFWLKKEQYPNFIKK